MKQLEYTYDDIIQALKDENDLNVPDDALFVLDYMDAFFLIM